MEVKEAIRQWLSDAFICSKADAEHIVSMFCFGLGSSLAFDLVSLVLYQLNQPGCVALIYHLLNFVSLEYLILMILLVWGYTILSIGSIFQQLH